MRKTILRNYLYDNALQKTTFLCCKSMVFTMQLILEKEEKSKLV